MPPLRQPHPSQSAARGRHLPVGPVLMEPLLRQRPQEHPRRGYQSRLGRRHHVRLPPKVARAENRSLKTKTTPPFSFSAPKKSFVHQVDSFFRVGKNISIPFPLFFFAFRRRKNRPNRSAFFFVPLFTPPRRVLQLLRSRMKIKIVFFVPTRRQLRFSRQ